ncbi:helix-turn-helix domain-containing protein [Microbacterium sp. 2MCAF23]|uniref:helix-turn-helix domain-containing protein n=1 Tax=Microbacterium sp. 2MCAF23 TaxID=3232985 RepID=UPI003F978499
MPETPEDPRVELGRRLAELRVNQSLTIQGLAAACELDVSNLRKIEKGLGNPRLATVLKVAGVLEADLRELFGGLDPYGLTGKDHPQPLSAFNDTFWRPKDRIA